MQNYLLKDRFIIDQNYIFKNLFNEWKIRILKK